MSPLLYRVFITGAATVAFVAILAAAPVPSPTGDALTCFVIECQEGCSGGAGCKANEKCIDPICEATVKKKNCKEGVE